MKSSIEMRLAVRETICYSWYEAKMLQKELEKIGYFASFMRTGNHFTVYYWY